MRTDQKEKWKDFSRKSKLNGKWIKWFEDGKKWEEGYYLNGNEVGQWTYWRDDGTKVRRGGCTMSIQFRTH